MQQPNYNHPDGNLPRPPGRDVEGGGSGETPVLKPHQGVNEGMPLKKGDWMKTWVFISRVCAMAGAFLSFILMVFISDFTQYQELSYVFSIALIATVYTTVQVGIKGHELRTKKDVMPPDVSVWIDFCGDQFITYMLFSSASVGATFSNAFRSLGYVTSGVDLAAASTSMSFLAFLFLALVTLFSAHHLFSKK